MEEIEQREVIKHCLGAGMTPVDTLKFMNAGKSCKHGLVYKWHARFLNGREHITVHVQTSKHLLERYAQEGKLFLQSIITCDESWLHFYDPKTKPSQWCGNIHHHLHQRRLRSSSLLKKIRRSRQRITKRYPISCLFFFLFFFA